MYAQYTRVFGTCKEPQKSIKFSPFYRERGPQKILLYFWGEGANEQKTNKRKKRVCLVKSKSCDAYAPSHEPVKNPVISSKFCRFKEDIIKSNSRRFGRTIFKHPKGCLFISIPCNTLYVIPSENMGAPRNTVYSRGKGAHKQKSERYRP